jgi:hypothetical protein
MKEPEPYDGTQNAKMLGNFCWDMEQYLEQMNGSPEEAKVNVVVMYLTGTVKLWWRNRVEDLAAGRITEKIENWTEMKATLKTQFGWGTKLGSLGTSCWLFDILERSKHTSRSSQV